MYGESHLIDGGVVCNLPVNLLDTKKCIAVSTFGGIESATIDYKKKTWRISPKTSLFGINYSLVAKTVALLIQQNEEKSIALARQAGKDVTLLAPTLAYSMLEF